MDLPDALAKRAKMVAVSRGISLKALVVEALEGRLDASSAKGRRTPLRFPLIRSSKPGAYPLTPQEVHDILLREEAAAYEVADRHQCASCPC